MRLLGREMSGVASARDAVPAARRKVEKRMFLLREMGGMSDQNGNKRIELNGMRQEESEFKKIKLYVATASFCWFVRSISGYPKPTRSVASA